VIEAVIVDSGGANLASLRYALERLGARAQVSADARTIASAARVILRAWVPPGMPWRGCARPGSPGCCERWNNRARICLGMQLLFEASEEDATECLGVMPLSARRLEPTAGHPVPHMGWNQLCRLRPDPLLEGVPEGAWAYFVHSYAAPLTEHTLASAEYGAAVSAVVRRGNFWAHSSTRSARRPPAGACSRIS